MKNYLLTILLATSLTACGAMGFGKNDSVQIHNQSNSTIHASGSYGTFSIDAKSSRAITGEKITITSELQNCPITDVKKKLNGTALAWDVFVGIPFAYGIPLIVDAITGDLKTMPKEYAYICQN